MRRLYFLVPDADTCHSLAEELRALGIDDGHLHLVGADQRTIHDVNPASILQTSDLVHGVIGGLLVGGLAGLLGGWLAIHYAPVALDLGGRALAGTTLAGALFGMVVAGMVAKDMPNRALRRYERAILTGWYLLIVDVPAERMDPVVRTIRGHHPEADIRITVPRAPALRHGR